MTEKESMKPFDFLKKRAFELGAIEANVIPVEKIVVEDRVVLKCKMGCEKYGKTLACPPYAPTPSEFRKIVGEYHHALLMRFGSRAEIDSALRKHLGNPNVPSAVKANVDAFWSAWREDMNCLRENVIKLEKEAFEKGFPLAIGLVSGSCNICEKCNVEKGICIHPEMRRFSEEGVGVNVKATAEKAGIRFTLPFQKNPETFALLLID